MPGLLARGHIPFIKEMRNDRYSSAVRTRAAALLAFDEGRSAQGVAETVNVSATWAGSLRKQYREKRMESFPANARRVAVRAIGRPIPIGGPEGTPPQEPSLLSAEHRPLIEALSEAPFSESTRRRAGILLHYDNGMSSREVMAATGVSYITVNGWHRRYRHQGLDIFSERNVALARRRLESTNALEHDGSPSAAAREVSVLLEEDDRVVVEELASGRFRDSAQRKAAILLRYDEGMSSREVMAATHSSYGTVSGWRKRYKSEGLGIFNALDVERARRAVEAKGDDIAESDSTVHLLDYGDREILEALCASRFSPSVQRRAAALLAFDTGASPSEVSNLLNISYASVVTCKRDYRNKGLQGTFSEHDLLSARRAVESPDSVAEVAVQPAISRLLAPKDRALVEEMTGDTYRATVQRRARGLLMLDKGVSGPKVAEAVGLSYASVASWRQSYRKKGIKSFPAHALMQAEVRLAAEAVDAPEAVDAVDSAPPADGVLLRTDHRALLEVLATGDYDHKTTRVAKALLHMDDGHTARSATDVAGVSYNSILNWRNNYRKLGLSKFNPRDLASAENILAGTAAPKAAAEKPVASSAASAPEEATAPAQTTLDKPMAPTMDGGALLTPEHRAIMEELRSGPAPYSAASRRRANLLLLYDDGLSTKDVVVASGMSPASATSVRRVYRLNSLGVVRQDDVRLAQQSLETSAEPRVEKAPVVVEEMPHRVKEAPESVEVAPQVEEESPQAVEDAPQVTKKPPKKKAKKKAKKAKAGKKKGKKKKKKKKKGRTQKQPGILLVQGLQGVSAADLAAGTGQLYILLPVQHPQ